jgi:5'-deoxynucleotidase YfbR-like HD superfamily hydrolase
MLVARLRLADEQSIEDVGAGWEAYRPPFDGDDVRRDIDALLAALKLYSTRRFMHQRFWEDETKAAAYAAQIEPHPRLESVAEHSWHVADAVLLLSDHFPFVDTANALRLAVLHDKMEMFIGDRNPVGRDGTGRSTHAFHLEQRWNKERDEEMAIDRYLTSLRPACRPNQARSLYEALHGRTADARFVKAVDKLAALAFVVTKKRGLMVDKHLFFTLRYSEKALEHFPPLEAHYDELKRRLVRALARSREARIGDIERLIRQTRAQLALF